MKIYTTIKEASFTAKSKESGKVVNFASQQNRDNAIKSGEYEETDSAGGEPAAAKPKVNIFDKPKPQAQPASDGDGGSKPSSMVAPAVVKTPVDVLKSKVEKWSEKEKAFFRDGVHKQDSPERRNWKDAIKDKAKGAIAAIKKGAKHEVEEFKAAGAGVKNFFSGKELSEHEKKALKAVAIKVATTAIFGAVTGGAGHGVLAFGKHVAMEFIPHIVGETILKGAGTAALFAGDEDEDINMERFMAIIADKMANEKITPELMTQMVDSYNAKKVEGDSVNEEITELTPDQSEMVQGIIDMLLQIKDTDNRMEVAQQQIQNFKDEEIIFNYAWFLSAAGLDNNDEPVRMDVKTQPQHIINKESIMIGKINEDFKHIIHVDTPTQIVSKPIAAQILALAKKGIRSKDIGLEMGFVGNAKLATDTFQKVKNKIYFELGNKNESVNEAKYIQPKDDWGVRLVVAINNNVKGLHTSVIREKRDVKESVDAFGTMLKNAIRETLKHKYKPHPKAKDADIKIKTFISELKKFENIVDMVIAKPTKIGVTKLDDAWRSIWNHKYAAEIALAGELFNSLIEGNVNEVASRTAMEIGALTGTNKDFIQSFVDKHNLDIEKVFQYVKKGKLKDRMDFVTAVVGKDNNPYQTKLIKQFKESVNEERILVRKVMGDDAEKFLKKYPKVKQVMSVIAKKNTDLMKGYKAFLKFKDAQEDYLGGRAEVSSSPTFGSKTFYKYDWGNLKNHWPEVYQYIYTLHFGGLDGATVEGINEAMGNDKSMLALADVLSNSMEHYDEGDFLQSVRGGQGWSGIAGFQNSGLIPVFKSIYKKYWTVSPQNRTNWTLKDWIKWLKPFGLEENWDSEMEPVEESTPGEQIQNLNNRIIKLRQEMAKAKSPEAKNVIQARMKNALQSLSNKKKDMGIQKP